MISIHKNNKNLHQIETKINKILPSKKLQFIFKNT